MPAKKSENYLSVLNLDRDKLSVCDTKSASTPVFVFPPNTVRDLEIINKDVLSAQFKKFIQDKHLEPGQIIMILSPNVYYEKNLLNLSELEKDTEIQKFLDAIPFASISSHLFHIGNDTKIAAINRDFYESFRVVLEEEGFRVSAAVPEFVVNSFGVKDRFDIEACKLILKKNDFILQNNFLTPHKEQNTFGQSQRSFLNRNPVLVVIATVLLLILLGVTAYFTLRRPKKVFVATSPIRQTALPAPSVFPTPEPATPSADISALTLQILNGSGRPGLAGKVQKELETLGLVKITTGNAPAISQKTTITYRPEIDSKIRENISNKLKIYFSDFSAKDASDSAFDIIITTGKPL